eukprot:1103104-Alexandrium_andersonii.AAC.1
MSIDICRSSFSYHVVFPFVLVAIPLAVVKSSCHRVQAESGLNFHPARPRHQGPASFRVLDPMVTAKQDCERA